MSQRPDLIADIAALTARLRALSNAAAVADPAERARFLADKDALFARIDATHRSEELAAASGQPGDEWTDYRTLTTTEAADELVARGVPPDEAPEMVERYLGALTWERGWSPQDQWEIDDDDIGLMLGAPSGGVEIPVADHPAAHLGLTGAEGPPIDAGPALTAEEAAHDLAADGRSLDEARLLVSGYLDDVSAQIGASAHLWGLDAADLDAIRVGERARTTAAVERAHDAVTALPATAEDDAVADDQPADDHADALVLEQP